MDTPQFDFPNQAVRGGYVDAPTPRPADFSVASRARAAFNIGINEIVNVCGSPMIVVEIKHSRPANPYIGIKLNGNGAPYKFGPRHNPAKANPPQFVNENHPAVVAYKNRRAGRKPDAMVTAKLLARTVLDGWTSSGSEIARSLAKEVLEL